MHDVRIKKFAARYRLPSALWSERRRLENVAATVLHEALELALEQANVPEEGELCIRQIYAPIRLRLTNTDAVLAMLWSESLAAEIARAVRGGSSANVVFYPSRRQAIRDLVLQVVRRDLRRDWAWQQLGLWPTSDVTSDRGALSQALQAMEAALDVEPAAPLALLQMLAAEGLLEDFVARLEEADWEQLAQPLRAIVRWSEEEGATVTPSAEALHIALRVLPVSRLVRAVLATHRPFAPASAAYRTIAVLALMETEPMVLRTKQAAGVLKLIAEAMQASRADAPPGAEKTAPALLDAKAEAATERGTASLSEAELPTEMATSAEELPVTDGRQRGETAVGGLLFFLGLVEDLGLPDELAAHPSLRARSLRWTLHQLALMLVAGTANDPAVLAFAGLLPEAVVPSMTEPPPREAEIELLQACRHRLLQRLRERLEAHDETDQRLLEWVCERRAEIVADPGWIEAHFALDTVSTEVRRAGLDLDPGYLPWLGVVVKFVYE